MLTLAQRTGQLYFLAAVTLWSGSMLSTVSSSQSGSHASPPVSAESTCHRQPWRFWPRRVCSRFHAGETCRPWQPRMTGNSSPPDDPIRCRHASTLHAHHRDRPPDCHRRLPLVRPVGSDQRTLALSQSSSTGSPGNAASRTAPVWSCIARALPQCAPATKASPTFSVPR